jgi:protein AATF/BFR2
VRDPAKFIHRTRLPVGSFPTPYGEPQSGASLGSAATAAAAIALSGDAAGPDTSGTTTSAVVVDQSVRDSETFDDGEFYQQLLREFLEAGGDGSGAAAGTMRSSKKLRKKVDRRASKGRKIRYNVQEKLVNFMTSVSREPPTFAPQLFANLFGFHGGAGME